MRHRHVIHSGLTAVVAVSVLFWQQPASAENSLFIYSDTPYYTQYNNLSLKQPSAGTGFTMRHMQWDAGAFKASPYYGLRFTHYFDKHPNWGVALDFKHYQSQMHINPTLVTDGVGRGTATDSLLRMNRHFDISHGASTLSLNGMYRWTNASLSNSRFQPYVGAGLAYYRPHSENTSSNLHDARYDVSGFGYQLLGGMHYRLSRQWGFYAEMKFNSSTTRSSNADRAEMSSRTYHALGGVQFSF